MATVLELVCFTYISLSVSATVCDALPVNTAALAVLSVSVALGGDVAIGYLVWGFISGVIWSSCASFELGTLSELVYVIPAFCLSDKRLAVQDKPLRQQDNTSKLGVEERKSCDQMNGRAWED